MDKNKLYYFAHPYTGESINDRLKNFKICIDRTRMLLKNDFKIFAPIVYTHPLDIECDFFDYNFWIQFDETFMDICDGIILAPEWETSKGCGIEKEYFEKQNKEILFFSDIILQ